MKQSHTWIEMVEADCPYCKYTNVDYGSYGEGDKLICAKCKKEFILGEQK
jgi:transposase-like protein